MRVHIATTRQNQPAALDDAKQKGQLVEPKKLVYVIYLDWAVDGKIHKKPWDGTTEVVGFLLEFQSTIFGC